MNERCWILVSVQEATGAAWPVQKRRPVRGQPASVEADWPWALSREEQHGDVAGFLHTHPAGEGTMPSARDVRTMRAWCSAFGKPLLCLIQDRSRLEGYLFQDDESEGRPVRAVVRVKSGEFEVYM